MPLPSLNLNAVQFAVLGIPGGEIIPWPKRERETAAKEASPSRHSGDAGCETTVNIFAFGGVRHHFAQLTTITYYIEQMEDKIFDNHVRLRLFS